MVALSAQEPIWLAVCVFHGLDKVKKRHTERSAGRASANASKGHAITAKIKIICVYIRE